MSGRVQVAARAIPVSLPHEDLVSSLLAWVIVTALYFDGRAHVLGLPDSFFTPWHAFLYGGLLLLVGWLAVLSRMTARRQGAGRFAVVPTGYGPAVAGAVIFGVGGVADMVWHEVFGIESGLDALLSPTHLVLFAGGSLLFSGPVRAVRGRAGSPGPLAAVASALSVTAIAGIVAFALSYISGFLADQPAYPLSNAAEGSAEHIASDAMASAGLASYVVTSLVIVVPLTFMLRLGIVPPGAVFFLVTSLAVLGEVLYDFTNPWVMGAGAVAGAVAELVLAGLRRRGARLRLQELILAALLPLLLWPGQLLAIEVLWHVQWSPELINGVVIVSSVLSFMTVLVLGVPARQDRGTSLHR
ncbi:hypothetical protein R5O87_19240 [Arthrobacter globiformis]|uniref:hypothetical protein n=1 Tax=Arthrobacter globiformis TaxID=1665 RepID=UPI00397D16B8